MDVFNFCWVTLLNESKKHSVFLGIDNCQVENDCDEEFDKPIKRIAFWYKYANFNIYFFKHCLANFIESSPDSRKIIDQISTVKNLNICSLSTGPGSYVIGFLYTLHLLGIPMCKSIDFKFITKHGHWRHFVSEMLNSGTVNVPESSSCHLIQCDILTELSSKAQSYIKSADVLFVCNTFSSPRAKKDVTLNVLKDILQLLKPGALLFFVANEETSSYLKEFNFFGHFLYGPTNITVENIPYDTKITELIGVNPVDSGSSYFAVWQKFDSILEKSPPNQIPTPVKFIKVAPFNEFDEPIGNVNEKNAKTTNNSIATNIPMLKQDAFNLKSSTNFSSAAHNNTSILTGNNIPSTGKFKEKSSQTTCTTQTDLFNCKKEHCAQSVQTDVMKTNQKIQLSEKHSTKAESSLNSLIKTVERLVTNLDEFVCLQNTIKNSGDQKDSTCAGHVPNTHHTEKVCQHHNFSGCAYNHLHSSCIQSCMSLNNSHCYHCCRSINHNHQNVASIVPHLVVPLHNLTEQTLSQVLSLVSSSNN